jgi:hypothetical protein
MMKKKITTEMCERCFKKEGGVRCVRDVLKTREECVREL